MPHSHPIYVPVLTVPSLLAHEFASAFADSMTAMHVAPNLTCSEVEALAAVLDAFDGADAARMWVEEHQTAGDCLIDHGETAEDDEPGWEDDAAPEGKAAAPADGDDQDDDDQDDDEWDDDMVSMRMGITCAEACVFHIPAVVRLPKEIAAGVQAAIDSGRADDWDDMHPGMAELYEYLESNREEWEPQLDMGVHTQDGEDLEIRSVEPEGM